MGGRDDVIARLRAATRAETEALAKILGLELTGERDVDLVHLADTYRSAASERDFRKIVEAVAKEVAGQVGWKVESLPATTECTWIEDYIYQALGFMHRPDRQSLSDFEKAKERERAEQALQGRLPPPDEQSVVAGLATAAGGAALAFFFGAWVAAPFAALVAIGWLLGPSMKKVVPATLLLIHIRKREEFEQVLVGGTETA
jgi:hypothetical protein